MICLKTVSEQRIMPPQHSFRLTCHDQPMLLWGLPSSWPCITAEYSFVASDSRRVPPRCVLPCVSHCSSRARHVCLQQHQLLHHVCNEEHTLGGRDQTPTVRGNPSVAAAPPLLSAAPLLKVENIGNAPPLLCRTTTTDSQLLKPEGVV